MKIEVAEVLRYLRAGEEERTVKLIEEIAEVVSRTITPKSIKASYLPKRTEDGYALEGTDVVFKGKLIEKTLSASTKVHLFIATLTLQSERLMAKYSAADMERAVIADACMTAYIEAYCDQTEGEIAAEERLMGRRTLPRISCGYGDFDIACQRDFVRLLNAEKLLGIKLNQSGMFVPNKTVTALVAVTSGEADLKTGCGVCGFGGCGYKKQNADVK